MGLSGFFEIIFGWAMNIDPTFGLFFITLIVALIVTLVYKFATNQKFMKETKQELKNMRKDMKKHRSDVKKMGEIQKEMMGKNMKMMKQQIVPMVITFLPIILIFGWMRASYVDYAFPGIGMSWIWTYIIFSVVLTLLLRKVMKVY